MKNYYKKSWKLKLLQNYENIPDKRKKDKNRKVWSWTKIFSFGRKYFAIELNLSCEKINDQVLQEKVTFIFGHSRKVWRDLLSLEWEILFESEQIKQTQPDLNTKPSHLWAEISLTFKGVPHKIWRFIRSLFRLRRLPQLIKRVPQNGFS